MEEAEKKEKIDVDKLIHQKAQEILKIKGEIHALGLQREKLHTELAALDENSAENRKRKLDKDSFYLCICKGMKTLLIKIRNRYLKKKKSFFSFLKSIANMHIMCQKDPH